MNSVDVLLVLPPMYHTGRIPDYNPKEPLGLMYLAAYLRKCGFAVEVLDADLKALSIADTIDTILKSNAPIIGFSTLQRALPSVKLVIDLLRGNHCSAHICFGGFSATLSAKHILREIRGVDSIVLGEGELVFSELVSALIKGRAWQNVPGLAYRRGDGVFFNGKSEKPDVNFLPDPARDLLPLCFEKTGYATILSSRGCYGNCTFCSNSSFEKFSNGCNWRGRNPIAVVDEIEYLHKKFGIHAFKFNDPNIFGPGRRGRDHVVQICHQLLNRKMALSLMAFCRGNDLDLEVAGLMRRAGFERLLLGIETSDPIAMNNFKKGESIAVIRRAISIIRKAKIDLVAGFMIFNPYTTIKTLKSDLSFLEENTLYPTLAKALRVFDGTPIQDVLATEGQLIWKSPFEGYHEYLVEPDIAAIYMSLKIFSIKWVDPFFKDCQSAIWEMKKAGTFNGRSGYYEFGRLIFRFNSLMLRALISWTENGFSYVDICSHTKKMKNEFNRIRAHLGIGDGDGGLKVKEISDEVHSILKRKNIETFPEKYRWNDD
jgi:anaerobic magnesium-protoporphyrin IX monomethyl ester cyclase